MTYAPHPIFILSEWADDIEGILNWLGMYEFAPESSFISWIGHQICNVESSPDLADVCANLAFAFLGFNPDQFNKTMIPVYLDHVPAGTATRPIVHYAQLHTYDSEFKKFDFGSAEKNMEHYRSPDPPYYNLDNVKTPVALWSADKDYLADSKDVYHLSRVLPNVISYELVNIPGFTHLDFAMAIDADIAIYKPLIDMMNKSFS